MQLRDIMTKSVETIGNDASLRFAATLMENENVGFLPVMRGGQMVGVITDRDITVRAVSRGLSPDETIVEQAMTEGVVALPENSEVEDAADLMEQHRVRRLVVTDENESLVGVVSLDKLSLYIGRYDMLEEDEFEGEAHADTREFPAGFDPAAQAGDDTDTSIGTDPDPAVVGNDPSVTAEAEVTPRDARDQTDPRKGPRSLIAKG
ncbi:MAG TPA: CBS domain-containing protein [Burkholderiales bacterium]